LDVNECAKYVGTDLGCQNGATCINTVGSYE
jgi:cubilin